MTTLYAKDLSLKDVHRVLGFQRGYNSSFTPLLSLESLTDFEQQELEQIREDFDNYLIDGEVSEGQVKLLAIAPLLRLAGFYRSPLKISLEENISRITIDDEDTSITGRLDILAVNKQRQITANTSSFWVLVIESKNSQVNALAGLAQLLTYTYNNLEHQESIWGLATNGMHYQFVYIQSENPPTYQLLPFLNLMEAESSMQVLRVLKAIRQL
ncbi:restriction endonuclease subunit R [Coleofasciculus sp. G2-EDA-02]|uniref:restriction endonuclease subunit R n=1 Tax=Coleofasciculus sp. G2-EDA-02 TaxID=3069529 RepID=UPI003302BB0A